MLTGSKLVVTLLLSAAALDIARCSLVVMTYRHFAPAFGLVAAGVAMAALTVIAARGYRAGRRWAAAVALLVGLASAPQASSSGFRPPFTIPDVATATLGVALAVAILASIGRGGPRPTRASPCAKSADPAAIRLSTRGGYEE
jgi:hypothetical protein